MAIIVFTGFSRKCQGFKGRIVDVEENIQAAGKRT